MNDIEQRILAMLKERKVPMVDVQKEMLDGIDYDAVNAKYLAYREAIFNLMVNRQMVCTDWENNLMLIPEPAV